MPNSISPISYTNKDFRSIYEEILTLAKELSYKWDPTISNESDPGVVLLKLNAIIGDKNNYNIDKNILEAFPETVTQQASARQLFAQLGYKMPWYKAANTEVTLKWIGRDLQIGEIIQIPKFTMVTNDESDVVYTLTEDVEITRFTKGGIATAKALQGSVVTYSIGGSQLITSNNFDRLNRLYLNDYNVAENGIFITNATDKSIEWTLVDNIQLYPVGSHVYEFNVDPRTNYCYLEFPEDFDVLIGSGINIKYIATNGSQGNVKSKNLTSFFNDISIKLSNEDIVLNSEVMEIYNNSAANDGADPEDIEGAYRSFKRVAGTFDTLVTLRDYINAIYNSGLISNGVVSDRMNDIQTTYSIITTNEESLNSEIIQEKLQSTSFKYVKINDVSNLIYRDDTYATYDSDSNTISLIKDATEFDAAKTTNRNIYALTTFPEEDLTAYDLRFYVLRNTNEITDLSQYNKSFELIPSQDPVISQLYGYIENSQCIQHNFKDILENRYCMFKTVYPLKIKIVPQYKLTDTQIVTLKNNVFDALRKALSSRQLEFGTEPDYDKIYNVIQNADSRIKFIILDDFEYITYAIYWDGQKFIEIPISEFTAENTIFDTHTNLENYAKDIKYNNCYMIDENFKCYIVKNKGLEEYSNKIQEFRTEILAKSVLAGVTPLFNVDNRFQYTVDRQQIDIEDDIYKLTTKLIISPFGGTISKEPSDSEEITNITITPNEGATEASTSYTLKPNESIHFYGPSFKTSESYSNYIKFVLILNEPTGFEYKLIDLNTADPISINNPVYLYQYDSQKGEFSYIAYESNSIVTNHEGERGTIKDLNVNGKLQVFRRENAFTIPPKVDYKLREGDQLIFFWRESQDEDSPYTYKKYTGIDETKVTRDSKGNILKSPVINSSFTIVANSKETSPVSLNQLKLDKGKIEHSPAINSSYYQVQQLYGDNDLSGSKTIDIKEMNEISLNSEDKPYYYFVTNNKSTNDNNIEYYNMEFLPDGNRWMYILQEDEYFIQVNATKSAYEIYGPGTLIQLKRESSEQSHEFNVKAIDYEIIATEGISAFENAVEELTEDIIIREQQLYTLTGGDTIYLTLDTDYFGKEAFKSNELDSNKDSNSTSDTIVELPYFILKENAITTSVKVTKKVISNENTEEIPTRYTLREITDNGKTTKYVLPSCVISKISSADSLTEDDVSETDKKFCYCNITRDGPINIFNPNKLAKPKSTSTDTTTIEDDVSNDSIIIVTKDNNTENYNITKKHSINDDGVYYKCTQVEYSADFSDHYYVYDDGSDILRIARESDIGSKLLYSIDKTIIYRPLIKNTFYKYNRDAQDTETYELIEDMFQDENIVGEDENTRKEYAETTAFTISFEIVTDSTKINEDSFEILEYKDSLEDSFTEPVSIEYNITYNQTSATTYPIFETDNYTDMSNITVTYSIDGSSTLESLPITDVGENDGSWKATAKLNIQSSNVSPQKLDVVDEYSAQMYYVHTNNGEKLYVIYDENNTGIKEVYILTNVEVSKVGGSNVDVSYVDLLGNRHGIDIQFYQKNDDIKTTDIESYWSDSSGNLHLKTNKSASFEITGIACDNDYFYILPIENTSLNCTFKVNFSGLSVDNGYTLHSTGVDYGNGKYYFVLPSNKSVTNGEVSMRIEISKNDNDTATNSVITLLPFVKYKEEELFKSKYNITVGKIIDKMQKLDTDNKFRYDYIVPEGKLISDPLSGKSFFNSNHICNNFTIAKANLDSTRTIDGIKALPNNSEILIVSNR